MTAKSKTFEEIKEELTKTLDWINQITKTVSSVVHDNANPPFSEEEMNQCQTRAREAKMALNELKSKDDFKQWNKDIPQEIKELVEYILQTEEWEEAGCSLGNWEEFLENVLKDLVESNGYILINSKVLLSILKSYIDSGDEDIRIPADFLETLL